MEYTNQVVFITGANRGIGKAYAEAFLAKGAKKIYLAVRDPNSVSDFVQQNPDVLIPIKLDVTSSEDIQNAANTAGDVTILINNAGILFVDTLSDADLLDKARQQMEVNYIGMLAMTQAFAPVLKRNGGGVLVLISSLVGHMVLPSIITYSASKFAAQALILGARLELRDQGTQVIGVYPGPIETDMTQEMDFEVTPANVVPEATFNAIENNENEVFPDPMAQDMMALLRNDPATLEQEIIKMQHQQEVA